jgi:hypothetical protein
MKKYESLNDAFCDLRRKGYENDFTIPSYGLYCGDLDMRLDPEDFHVDEIDRVEDNSKRGDTIVLYAISSSVGVKGTIIEDEDDAPSR